MRKVIAAFLLGVGLTFSASVYAEEIKSFIGTTIEGQFPVTVNGEAIDNPGIVVEGTSYLPTRTIAELAGFDVIFDADLGIKLNKKNTEPKEESNSVDSTIEQDPVVNKEVRIKQIENRLWELKAFIVVENGHFTLPSTDEAREAARVKISQYEAEIASLESEKAELEAQLAAE